MQPSKPFLFVLALTAVGAAIVATTPAAKPAAAQDAMPLSTHLTEEMSDYFGLGVAYERPSLPALVACAAAPACAANDTTQVRVLDADGERLAAYDDKPGTVIEQVRHVQTTPKAGVTEQRTLVRRYTTDEHARVVMSGTDSITRVDAGDAGRPGHTLTRVHRYANIQYLVNDPRFQYPLTGLVVTELTLTGAPRPVHDIEAMNFDGTNFAHVLTAGALTHRVDLKAKLLETQIPDR